MIDTLDVSAKISLLRKENEDIEGLKSEANHLNSKNQLRDRVHLLNVSETNPLINEDEATSDKEMASIRSKNDGFFYQPDLIKTQAHNGQIKIDLKRGQIQPTRSPFMPPTTKTSTMVMSTAPVSRRENNE